MELTLPVPHPLKDTEWVGDVEGEPEDDRQTLVVPDRVVSWLARRSVIVELIETVAQVEAQCEELSVPEADKLPDEVRHPEVVALWLGVCEVHWLLLPVMVLLEH